MVKLKICLGRKTQLVVSNQVVTNPCCGLAVIFCGFISLLIGRETINIPEIFSCVHGFDRNDCVAVHSQPENGQSNEFITLVNVESKVK